MQRNFTEMIKVLNQLTLSLSIKRIPRVHVFFLDKPSEREQNSSLEKRTALALKQQVNTNSQFQRNEFFHSHFTLALDTSSVRQEAWSEPCVRVKQRTQSHHDRIPDLEKLKIINACGCCFKFLSV